MRKLQKVSTYILYLFFKYNVLFLYVFIYILYIQNIFIFIYCKNIHACFRILYPTAKRLINAGCQNFLLDTYRLAVVTFN